MRFLDRAHDQPEPDDGLEARLTADAESWLQETSPSFTGTPAAVMPGILAEDDESPASDIRDDEGTDAPTVTAPVRGARARRAPLLGAAAVIALVAAVAIPLWTGRSHTAAPNPTPATAPATASAPASPVAAPRCPETDGGPLVDVGSIKPAAGSLVPAEEPISILICEYPLPLHPDPTDTTSVGAIVDFDFQDLRNSGTITAGLSSVPDDLSRFALNPEADCSFSTTSGPGMAAPSGSDFRVALSYPTGTIWIADSTGPNTCAIAGGSSATSTGSYVDLFARSLRTRAWKPSDHDSVECPLQVDATPYAGSNALPKPSIDTGGHLVPTDLPSAVVLCGYGEVQPEAQPEPKDVPGFDVPFAFISQRFELQGDFAPLISELRAAPSADPSIMRCPRPTDTPTPQLLGLTYGEGAQRQTIWIDARIGGTCGLTTNGAVWASGAIPESIRAAMAEESWAGMKVVDLTPDASGAMPSAPQTSPGSDAAAPVTAEPSQYSPSDPSPSLSPENEACVNPKFGGEGLAQTMVPVGYSAVFSCFDGRVQMPPGLVDEINGLSDPIDASGCPDGDSLELVQGAPFLVFLYPDRAPVLLNFVDSCAPSIGNGDHEVAAPKAILDELLKLAGY